jgi:hypothetical protein
MFGTNSVHLPELARHSISRDDLIDDCKSTYVAAWPLAKMVRKYGNSWEAVGAYYSETPFYRDRYKALIQQIIDFWIAQGLDEVVFRVQAPVGTYSTSSPSITPTIPILSAT